jgi:CubicO group peptidase (beta-lactamase class C family)
MKLLALWAIALAGPVSGQTPAQRVDALFHRWSNPQSPGCAVAVIQDGKTVHQRGYGMANLEHNIPITAESAFYLGSTSKQFTAMAVLHLVELGRVKLEDSIRKYLRPLPPFMEPVTIRHLLEHTSGVRDYVALWNLSGPAEDASLSTEEAFSLILRQKQLNFTPGEEFLYSNSGYFLLGLVAGPAAFRQLTDLAQEIIFQALGLKHTFYYPDRFQILPRRASGYSPTTLGLYRINTQTLDVVGDGGVFTTLQDMISWDSVLSNPPKTHARVVERMMTPGKLPGGEISEYGQGMMLRQYRGFPIATHPGGLRGYRSEILRFPEQKLSVICLCNAADAEAGILARQVAGVFLPQARTAPQPKLRMEDLKRKEGVFLDPVSGDLLRIWEQHGILAAEFNGLTLPLRAENAMRFRADGSPLDFTIDFRNAGSKDEPAFLRVHSETQRPARFERVTLLARPPENLGEFAGEYESEEAKARYSVRVFENQIQLFQREQLIGELIPTVADRFRLGSLNLEFQRQEKKLTGFRLNSGRVRQLWFSRLASTP